jgi:hypothetical protein
MKLFDRPINAMSAMVTMHNVTRLNTGFNKFSKINVTKMYEFILGPTSSSCGGLRFFFLNFGFCWFSVKFFLERFGQYLKKSKNRFSRVGY